jgi:hypothetical protein
MPAMCRMGARCLKQTEYTASLQYMKDLRRQFQTQDLDIVSAYDKSLVGCSIWTDVCG